MNGLLTMSNGRINEKFRTQMEDDIRNHRGWYIFEGIVFLFLAGLLAFLPGLTALSVEIVVSALLMAGGIFRIVQAFRSSNSRWWRGITGIIFAGVGAAMLIWPIMGLTALIWAIGTLLIIEGAYELFVSLTIRPLKNWGWLLVAGLASLVLGLFILFEFPIAGILYIAIAVALSMGLYGASLIALAWNAGEEKTI